MGTFQDSLKKWFYTNNSSAAAIDARVPLLNANGTPKGSDTMANVASVLNIAQYHTFVQSGSFNDLLEPGTWLCTPGKMDDKPSNIETGSNIQAILEIIKLGTEGLHVLQRLTMQGTPDVYVRTNATTSQPYTWGDWQFEYNTSILTRSGLLAPLASALVAPLKNIASGSNMNDLTTGGRYQCAAASTVGTLTNCPVTNAFFMDVVPFGMGLFFQILYSTTANAIYIRFKGTSSFSSWFKYSGTTE